MQESIPVLYEYVQASIKVPGSEWLILIPDWFSPGDIEVIPDYVIKGLKSDYSVRRKGQRITIKWTEPMTGTVYIKKR